MKIQKVIFSSSEEYSDFWEPISKIFNENLGIEPVLIYFGENKLSEKYGKVYYQKYLPYPNTIVICKNLVYKARTKYYMVIR